ncbi:MAG TPA: hypothetical protein VHF22_15205, partial [Planctomycetota bacterium]|nr:hypothetical protein [Planctomycetota bacterium]
MAGAGAGTGTGGGTGTGTGAGGGAGAGSATGTGKGRLAMHRGGTGEPLVLVHGIGSQWQVWRPVLEALERER